MHGSFQFIKFQQEKMAMIEEKVLTILSALKGEVTGDAQYVLGLGVFSVSYSVLALMRANRGFALPVTLFSVYLGYAASAHLGADFFLVLFGAAMATSTAVGWLVGRKKEQPD
jgi:hypothetical protein